MPEKKEILKEKADGSGLFDFKGFYNFAHSWLKEKEYTVIEKKYSEKIVGDSRDLVIEWVATKEFSDYFKIEHKIMFLIWGMSEVEVEVDGEKKKMNKGKVEIEIKGILVKDSKSKWETSAFNRFLRDVYNKYIIPHSIDDMEEKVRIDTIEFKDQLKAFLDLSAKR